MVPVPQRGRLLNKTTTQTQYRVQYVTAWWVQGLFSSEHEILHWNWGYIIKGLADTTFIMLMLHVQTSLFSFFTAFRHKTQISFFVSKRPYQLKQIFIQDSCPHTTKNCYVFLLREKRWQPQFAVIKVLLWQKNLPVIERKKDRKNGEKMQIRCWSFILSTKLYKKMCYCAAVIVWQVVFFPYFCTSEFLVGFSPSTYYLK